MNNLCIRKKNVYYIIIILVRYRNECFLESVALKFVAGPVLERDDDDDDGGGLQEPDDKCLIYLSLLFFYFLY